MRRCAFCGHPLGWLRARFRHKTCGGLCSTLLKWYGEGMLPSPTQIDRLQLLWAAWQVYERAQGGLPPPEDVQ